MQEIFDKQRDVMKEYGFDGLVTMSPENTQYVIGVNVPTQSTVRSRLVVSTITHHEDPVTVCVNIEEELVKTESWLDPDRVFSYNEFTVDPIVFAAEKMIEMGLKGGKVGIEFDYLSAKDYLKLKEVVPEIEFVDASRAFEDMRKIKMDWEIEVIRSLASGAEKVIFSAFDGVKAGMTENDMFAICNKVFSEIGGDKLTIMTIASGEKSTMLNSPPSDRILQKGDVVRLDLIGTKQGYLCDVCRTAVVGVPTERQSRIWELLVDSHDRIIAQIKPGVNTHDIFDDFDVNMQKAGFPASIDFVGHGLGLGLHEEPYINRFTHNILQEKMVLCVEPIYIDAPIAGYQLENEILVTKDGCEILSGSRPYDKLAFIRDE
ncbi:MAG TPA: aminopeptidase P family protein [Clostridiaceae bacterium]|nr:aminopeptidase P family protein [Clostridiaceae bacterium]